MSGEESTTFQKIKKLNEKEKVLISNHGYDELAADGLEVGEILQTIDSAVVLEDYPDFRKGPAVLLLQKDRENRPIYTVWGIPAGREEPAVLITAYRPDPERWSEDFKRRM
jgi:hypothetical protein